MNPSTDLSPIPEALFVGGAGGGDAAVPADYDVDGDLSPAPSATAEPAARGRLADYYDLTKPRMNGLVLATTVVGYYMGSPPGRGWGDWHVLLWALVGTALTAAGSAVLNQYVERDYDALMARTRRRPLPAGRVSPVEGLALGVLLSVSGLAVLALLVNGLTAVLGAVTLGTYVFFYTPLKRVTTLCTIVGAVPGALPPVMGVAAAAGEVTTAGWLLFGVLFLWQMPHFLAIAILYRDDYATGGFKMLPVVDPDGSATARQIVVYSLSLVPMTLLPAVMRVAGMYYFAAAVVMGLAFLGFGVLCALSRTRANARQLFFASILYLPCLLGMMMVDKV